MAYVNYLARRVMVPGHVFNDSYSLPVSLVSFEFAGRDLKTTQITKSGKRQTTYFGRDEIYRVVFAPMRDRDSAVMREFLSSTADGQLFTIDPHGSEAVPIKTMSVRRNDDGARETETMRDETELYVQFEIEIVVQ